MGFRAALFSRPYERVKGLGYTDNPETPQGAWLQKRVKGDGHSEV